MFLVGRFTSVSILFGMSSRNPLLFFKSAPSKAKMAQKDDKREVFDLNRALQETRKARRQSVRPPFLLHSSHFCKTDKIITYFKCYFKILKYHIIKMFENRIQENWQLEKNDPVYEWFNEKFLWKTHPITVRSGREEWIMMANFDFVIYFFPLLLGL